jgi:hypothetical protein
MMMEERTWRWWWRGTSLEVIFDVIFSTDINFNMDFNVDFSSMTFDMNLQRGLRHDLRQAIQRDKRDQGGPVIHVGHGPGGCTRLAGVATGHDRHRRKQHFKYGTSDVVDE